MSLKAYIGLPRAGKSYEVVVNVILPALRQGRRVVSNIAGLNYEAFCQILFREGFDSKKIGTLLLVSHADVEKPYFWRTDTDKDTGTESLIQPGDLVALDEIWRFWKKRGDIHPRAMNFCRMHGHMTHPRTGLTCEIALITQSIRDINENIRDVVQETFQMVKNTKLGSDKSYIVHLFQRGSTSKSDFIRTLPPRFYDAQFFPLYKSHSQHQEGDAAAKEKNPDTRGNIFHGALFRIGIPLALVFIFSGFYFVNKFFHPAGKQAVQDAASSPSTVKAIHDVPAPPVVSPMWRVLGYHRADYDLIISLVDSAGHIRHLRNPASYKLTPSGVEVVLPEGGFATSWTVLEHSSAVLPK